VSETLIRSHPIEQPAAQIVTPETDDGANSAPTSDYWLVSGRSNATLPEDVNEEPHGNDVIRGREARFAAAASRRAMKRMSSKRRDDAETR
jgi:hypothetical protein